MQVGQILTGYTQPTQKQEINTCGLSFFLVNYVCGLIHYQITHF